jgi:serine phosphatase RsbU (regulator of sigma subunit)
MMLDVDNARAMAAALVDRAIAAGADAADALYAGSASTSVQVRLGDLHPGDTLCMTTDGITEARRGRGREFFGMAGLLNALQEATAQPGAALETILESVLREAREFSGGSFTDDVCLLAARWR